MLRLGQISRPSPAAITKLKVYSRKFRQKHYVLSAKKPFTRQNIPPNFTLGKLLPRQNIKRQNVTWQFDTRQNVTWLEFFSAAVFICLSIWPAGVFFCISVYLPDQLKFFFLLMYVSFCLSTRLAEVFFCCCIYSSTCLARVFSAAVCI